MAEPIDPSSPGYRINALAFNALTEGLGDCDVFVALHDRDKIARKIMAAIEEEIRADERRRIAGGGALPSPAQIRAWLTAHGWTLRSTGSAGTAWDPPDRRRPVAVPGSDRDAALIAGVIARVANREGRTVPEVRGEMLATEVREDGGHDC